MNNLEELIHRIVREVKFQDDVIDIGAGLEAPYQLALQKRAHRLVLLDAHQPYLDANHTRGHNVERVCGVIPAAIGPGAFRDAEFDVAILIDVVEHLDRVQAHAVLLEAKRISRKVVLFTPEGSCPQDHDAYLMGADHWQTHRSEWTREALEKYEFAAGRMEDFRGLGAHSLFATWCRP
jgi:2-polyprenyl-3-methyl-5-hydroxy-6-metoxy-1,4-benzoquinol methylase